MNIDIPGPEDNGRLQRLRESQYRIPASLKTAMFDFYALYALWFVAGEGKRSYGYADGSIVNNRRGATIDDWFHASTMRFGSKMAQETLQAVKDELENVEDEYLIPPKAYKEWADSTGDDVLKSLYSEKPVSAAEFYGLDSDSRADPDLTTMGRVKLPENPIATLGVDRVFAILGAPFWKEHADLYAGKAWAKIFEAAINVVRAVKADRLTGETGAIMAIDKLMDLEHNTGQLVGKIEGAPSTQDLDTRAGIRNVSDFMPHVSRPVADLIRGTANVIQSTTESVAQWHDARKSVTNL